MSKMFLICPNSRAEQFLKKKFSDQQLYVSAPGCAFNDPGFNYYNAIASFLHSFPIQVITLMHKTRCRFSKHALHQNEDSVNFAVEEMRSVLRENYFDIIRSKRAEKREELLIKRHLLRQLTILQNHPTLFDLLKKKGIAIHLALWKGEQLEYFHTYRGMDTSNKMPRDLAVAF